MINTLLLCEVLKKLFYMYQLLKYFLAVITYSISGCYSYDHMEAGFTSTIVNCEIDILVHGKVCSIQFYVIKCVT